MISHTGQKMKTIYDDLVDNLDVIVAKLQGMPSGAYYLLVLTVFSVSWAASCTVPKLSGIMGIPLVLLFIVLIWIKE